MIFQERKMLSDLQRGTLLSKFHQQTANRKHRRDAKSAKRRISERKPAATAQAAPAHQASITTHASEFTTQTLCITPTLGKNDITLKHAVEILV